MKRMLFLGALVLSATVCSQSYGFELLDRMLGHHGCTDSCCEPACDAGAACCEPACDAGAACCEPACDAGASSCCEPRCRKKHELFGGLKGLFAKCKKRHTGCADSCCEPACDAGAACCEPGCDAGNGCCEPACDAGAACCEPACDAGSSCCEPRKKHCGPILGFFKALHTAKKRHHGCADSCCEPGCDAGNGCCEPGCDANGCCEPACGAQVYNSVEPSMAPTPVLDASASKVKSSRMVAAN